MAFRVSKTGYQQIDPTFSPGYPYANNYHNVGQLTTPYEGKRFGSGGDYGPVQNTAYYNVWNPNYPYVLDKDFRANSYLPTEGQCFDRPGYSPCYENRYPDIYIPEAYFTPSSVHAPSGHATPNQFQGRRTFCQEKKDIDYSNYSWNPLREHYGSGNTSDYTSLPMTYKRLGNYKMGLPH